MEIKTCEEYVLGELSKAQDQVSTLQDQVAELQGILISIQNILEVFMDDKGIRVEIDAYAQQDAGVRQFLGKLLGRGKYADTDSDAANNVEA